MKKLLVLALITVSLSSCSDGGNDCPQSLPVLEGEPVVMSVPMPAPAPRPPAPRPPAPKAPSAPKAPAPAPRPVAPKPAPKPYKPPAIIRPVDRYTPGYHQPVYINNGHDPMPYMWMMLAMNSSLHPTPHNEGCPK